MNCFQDNDHVGESLLDRRRREHQDLTDRILNRCELLQPADRALLQSLYSDHVPLTRLARVRGESPRQVRRRVRRLITQLLAPSTGFVLARRSDWDRERWQVARRHLIAGQDMRSTAIEMGLTLHTVRKHIEAVRTLFAEQDTRSDVAGRAQR